MGWGAALGFGLAMLLSGLFVTVAIAAPFVPPFAAEYPASLPPPEPDPSRWGTSAVLLLFFGPMFLLFARATYAAIRAARGLPPIRVVTRRMGWVIAIVYGGIGVALAVAVVVLDPSRWVEFVEMGTVSSLFFSAPFVAGWVENRRASAPTP